MIQRSDLRLLAASVSAGVGERQHPDEHDRDVYRAPTDDEFDEIARAWLRERLGVDAEDLADALDCEIEVVQHHDPYGSPYQIMHADADDIWKVVEVARFVLALLTEGDD